MPAAKLAATAQGSVGGGRHRDERDDGRRQREREELAKLDLVAERNEQEQAERITGLRGDGNRTDMTFCSPERMREIDKQRLVVIVVGDDEPGCECHHPVDRLLHLHPSFAGNFRSARALEPRRGARAFAVCSKGNVDYS